MHTPSPIYSFVSGIRSARLAARLEDPEQARIRRPVSNGALRIKDGFRTGFLAKPLLNLSPRQ